MFHVIPYFLILLKTIHFICSAADMFKPVRRGTLCGALWKFCIFMKLIFTLLHCSSFVNSTCVGGCVTWDVAVADIELCMVQVPSVTKSFIIGAHKWHNRVRVICSNFKYICECPVMQCGLLLSRLDLCIL